MCVSVCLSLCLCAWVRLSQPDLLPSTAEFFQIVAIQRLEVTSVLSRLTKREYSLDDPVIIVVVVVSCPSDRRVIVR